MNVWSAVLPILGLVIGWGLTQLTNYFNSNQSEKNILRETLYFLLELYAQIDATKMPQIRAESYTRIMKEKRPESVPDELYPQMVKYFTDLYTANDYPEIIDKLDKLNAKYDDCLTKLSAVAPIIAYQLRGKNTIIADLTKWRSSATQTIQNDPVMNDPKVQQLSESLFPEVETVRINSALAELKDFIFSIAKKTDRKTYKEVMQQPLFYPDDEKRKLIDANVEDYVVHTLIPQLIRSGFLADTSPAPAA